MMAKSVSWISAHDGKMDLVDKCSHSEMVQIEERVPQQHMPASQHFLR